MALATVSELGQWVVLKFLSPITRGPRFSLVEICSMNENHDCESLKRISFLFIGKVPALDTSK